MTYSIAARDPVTGELGVAVQSHYFAVGPVVPWVRAGVGAVATQSRVDVRYGPVGLRLMAAGYGAARALAACRELDADSEVRQVAFVDAGGGVAAHTGSRCIAEAGHRVGDGYSVQANLMERATVWDAMAEAFTAASGPLAERMLAALDAAEAEGGDIRGRQSAAMVVVRGPADLTGRAWEDRLVDLRVDDHPEPLVELRRLLRVRRAYDALNAGRLDEALSLLPEQPEVAFWAGVERARGGDVEGGAALLRGVFALDARWRETLLRLVPAERLDPEMVRDLLGRADGKPARIVFDPKRATEQDLEDIVRRLREGAAGSRKEEPPAK